MDTFSTTSLPLQGCTIVAWVLSRTSMWHIPYIRCGDVYMCMCMHACMYVQMHMCFVYVCVYMLLCICYCVCMLCTWYSFVCMLLFIVM